MAADWQRRAGNGDGGEVFYAPFSPAHYRSSCHQVLLVGGASSDRSRPPSWRPRRVPHHLIRLISLAPSPSLIMKGEGVRYFFQASNEAMASIPSWSISSRLIISSHPHHEASRPSSRPMRLAHHLERIPSPGHQRGKSDDEVSKRTRKNRKAGTRNGEQDGARAERTQQDNGKRERGEDGRQASSEWTTRIYDAITHKNNASHHSRPTPSPGLLSVRRPHIIPRPRGVGRDGRE